VKAPTRADLAFYGFCRAIVVGLSHVLFPGPVIGRKHLPDHGPYVLAPVHRSNLDWLIVARITRRRLRYLVKGEVWKVPAVGRLLEALGAFPVNRNAADREAFNRALEVLLAGEPLVVFPEGTRGSGPLVGELRDGAAYLALRAGVPIVPVGLAGTENALARGARFVRPSRVRIVIGAPLVPTPGPTGEEKRSRVARSATHELSQQLQDAIQGLLSDAQGQLNGRRKAKQVVFEAPANNEAGDAGHLDD
jgi:1-acyl-sn-glycerol-3-phosphate acyltransferase